ncbi:hypothetical protein RUND412_001330 [Rhizina undulata]
MHEKAASPLANNAETTSSEARNAVNTRRLQVGFPSPVKTSWDKAVDKLDPEYRKEFNLEDAISAVHLQRSCKQRMISNKNARLRGGRIGKRTEMK